MWAIGALALLVYLLTAGPRTTNDDHLAFAYAMLHGHLYVDFVGLWEHAAWRGYAYSLHPPLSALVCLPFVALWGPDASQNHILLALGIIGGMLAYRLTRSVWLTLFWYFGTAYWYETTLGAAWGFCLVLSTLPTLMALLTLKHDRSPFKLGCWAGIAALARYDLVLVWPVYWLCLRARHGARRDAATGPLLPSLKHCALLYLLPLAVVAALYVSLNEARYGRWYDMGYQLWYLVDDVGARLHPGHGPLSLAYFPTNLYTALFAGPRLLPQWPFIEPKPWGMSLLLTSPAVVLALRSQNLKLWLALGLAMGPSMLVYAPGYTQLGYRYAIQAMPFVLALMAEGEVDQMAKILIIASMAINAFGVCLYRGLL